MNASKYELPEVPRRCADLAEIAPQYRECYEAAPGGGYVMNAQAIRQQNAFEAACAEIEAEHDAAHEARREAIARLEARVRENAVAAELRRALAAAGVELDLRPGAAALLRDQLRLRVEDDSEGTPVVEVEGEFGLSSVGHAVESWLEDEGAAYRPKPKAGAAGEFSALMAQLRGRK